jgi:hypothetical protein
MHVEWELRSVQRGQSHATACTGSIAKRRGGFTTGGDRQGATARDEKLAVQSITHIWPAVPKAVPQHPTDQPRCCFTQPTTHKERVLQGLWLIFARGKTVGAACSQYRRGKIDTVARKKQQLKAVPASEP